MSFRFLEYLAQPGLGIEDRVIADDIDTLTNLNDRFIDAFRRGDWESLDPILSPTFVYLDGTTGAVSDRDVYAKDMAANPLPSLAIDQVMVHVDGGTAVVSARTSTTPGRYSRYIDTYERRDSGWTCIHACVWPITPR